jgi:hypothetical protein
MLHAITLRRLMASLRCHSPVRCASLRPLPRIGCVNPGYGGGLHVRNGNDTLR